MKKFFKILGILLLVLVILALAAAGTAYHYYTDALKPADPDGKSESQIIEIKQGMYAGEIAQMLEDKKLIKSALAFRIMMRLDEKGGDIKTGHFKISPQDTPDKILDILIKGDTLKKKITFPEGLTLEQTIALVKEKNVCDAAKFRELVTYEGKAFGNFPARLEGYLLPDTYEIPWVCSANELVTIMTSRFDELARPIWNEKSPLPFSDTIVLASLVEREAQVASERPLIAGVYVNRLRDKMLLECDATIQYALGKQKEILLYSDLKIDSPYNTYKYPGLPPGPICCPGTAAIEAACHPKSSPYYYYVRNDVKGDGSHVFSKNFAEHNRAIAKYQR